ncbi:unnamed protein product [marine sediment metagenome]|uniref:Uncharacterized protein n=1 Tax=marine sediment metagenome TaxID=412755 RepID=X1P6H6_9ZZZZ
MPNNDTDQLAQLNQDRAKDSKQTVKIKPKAAKSTSEITDVEFFLVLCLSILKDVLDWILLLAGGIGLILSRLTNIAITGILWLWCLMRLRKFPTKRFLGGFLIEMIPLVGTFSPTWTIFIITIWAEQKGYMPEWIGKLVGAKA